MRQIFAGSRPLQAALVCVFLALAAGSVVSVVLAGEASKPRSRLIDEVEPFARSVDALRVEARDAATSGERITRDPRAAADYEAAAGRTELARDRVVARGAAAGFGNEATALAAEASAILTIVNGAIQGDAPEALEALSAQLSRFTGAALGLRASLDRVIENLRAEIARDDQAARTALIATSGLGGLAVVAALLMVLRQERIFRQERRARRRFDTIVEATGAGVYVIDAHRRIDYVNPAAEELLGFEPGELRGAPAHAALHHTHPTGAVYPEKDCPLIGVIRDARPHTGEHHLIRKDGAFLPVEASSAPIREGRRAMGAVVVFQDLTAQLEQRALQEEFASIASHELRTPLTSIIGFARALERRVRRSPEAFAEPEREAIATLSAEAQRMADTVQIILDLAALGSRGLQLEQYPVDVLAVVQEEIRTAEHGTATLQFQCHAPAPPLTIVSDEQRIRQILGNLFSNAAKYGEAGGRVDVSVDHDDQAIAIRVRDYGPGVPEADRERIFDRFYRSRRGEGTKGLGLGLFISRQIAAQLGGALAYEPTDGPGAQFVLRLPRNVGSMPASPARPRRAASGARPGL